MEAIGCPVNEANLIRFYVNNEAMGLFTVVDDVGKDSFALAMFHGTQDPYPETHGVLQEGMASAYFVPGDQYNFLLLPTHTFMLDPVEQALAALGSDDASLAQLTAVFDVDTFLRAMAMEYLNNHWDGYWAYGSNFGVYTDTAVTPAMSHFVDQDFDNTFGINSPINAVEEAGKSYKTWEAAYQASAMIAKLLKVPSQRTKFETYLKDIVTYLYNDNVLVARINAMRSRLAEEVAWDRAIVQKSPGKDYAWTAADYELGFESATKTSSIGFIKWIQERSNAVATEFSLTPTTARNLGVPERVNMKYNPVPDNSTSTKGSNGPTGNGVVNGDGTPEVQSSSASTVMISLVTVLIVVSAALL
jgi:hypothetical protein